MKKTSVVLLMLVVAWIPTWAQDVRSQLRQIAADLAKQIEAKGKKRVVIASFLDLKNQETELGRYMSDKFSIGMASSSLEITDRSQLAQLLRDNKLGADRILDPKTIPKLGQITGAEVIITGNYTALDNSVDITVKAIDLERGLRIAVAEGVVARTSEINKLLSEVSTSEPYTIMAVNEINNSTATKLPKPATDCATQPSCVICVTNKSSEAIKARIWNRTKLWEHTLYIEPNQLECMREIPFYHNNFNDAEISYYHPTNGQLYKIDKLVIKPCGIYHREFKQ